MIGQLSKEEVNRKLLHVLAVILPLSIFYGPLYADVHRFYACLIILLLLFCSLLIEFFRLRKSVFANWFSNNFGSMMRIEESNQLTGATYVLGGSAICSLISLHSDLASVCSFLCLTLFVLGDAAAAIVGKAVGRIKIGKKTLEGGIGCFLLCVLLAGMLFPSLPLFSKLWGGSITLIQILIISAAVSILEFFPIKWKAFTLNDNLYVPGVSAVIAFFVNSL
jgi:dolichol kinase